MPKIIEPLSALAVKRDIATPGLHMVGGVPGLALRVSPTGARSWILRIKIGEKRRDIGIGSFPAVTLAQAREKAREMREQVKNGIDPIEEARQRRSALLAQQAAAVTFDQCAAAYIAAKEKEWRNPKHGQQWRNTIRTYASPILGKMLIRDIEQTHVLRVLEPIWLEKNETASRLRGRIEAILDWARVRGYRRGDNPARWKGHLEVLLPSPGKVQKNEHFPALPFAQMANFLKDLRQQKGIAARALEFLIMTACRSGEVRGAKWEEINLAEATWTIPANRMKAKKEHRIALNNEAMAILLAIPESERQGLIFPGVRGKPLSDMTLKKVIERMNEHRERDGLPRWTDPKQNNRDVTPHGFRSTFDDWAAERTNHADQTIEMALAHTISDQVKGAYRRGDLFEKRRQLMADWADYCTTEPGKTATVIAIRSAA